MEHFEIASICRKIRDDILYFKYGKTRLATEYPIETKQFFEITSLKIKSTSYQSIKDIEKDIQDYADSIGLIHFPIAKKNSFEKFLKNLIDEYSPGHEVKDEKEGKHKINQCNQNEDSSDSGSDSDDDDDVNNKNTFLSSGKQTYKEYDNFTEVDTETFAGYSQAVYRALLPHYRSNILGASYLGPSTSSLCNSNQFESEAAQDLVAVEHILSRVHDHGRALGEKLAQRYGINNLEAIWKVQEDQVRTKSRHSGVGTHSGSDYYTDRGASGYNQNQLIIPTSSSSSSGRVIRNPYMRNGSMYDYDASVIRVAVGQSAGRTVTQSEGTVKSSSETSSRKKYKLSFGATNTIIHSTTSSRNNMKRVIEEQSISTGKKTRSSPISDGNPSPNTNSTVAQLVKSSAQSTKQSVQSRPTTTQSAISNAIATAVARGVLPYSDIHATKDHAPMKRTTTSTTTSNHAVSLQTPTVKTAKTHSTANNHNNTSRGSNDKSSSSNSNNNNSRNHVKSSTIVTNHTDIPSSKIKLSTKVSTHSVLDPTPVVGYVGVTQDHSVNGITNYFSEATVYGRQVHLGSYTSINLAAQAHDLALIRAIGPAACTNKDLNFPIKEYSSVPLSHFAAYDDSLRKRLFGSSWTGPKPCDFSFLLLRSGSSSGGGVSGVSGK